MDEPPGKLERRMYVIRILDAALQIIHHKAEQADMSLTDYVTTCCLGKEIVVVNGLEKVIRQQ